ncbi:MAG: SagB/ThcOx family dehydrogenase [Desulfobacterales bacterium]|nr:SagB/ThcOx family dehydrogenase [Desulfobacterales bacterium]
MPTDQSEPCIELPSPSYDGTVSIEVTLFKRRSVRAFSPKPLVLNDISQLLWSAQGVTSPRGYRTAPSAGALYPLEIHLIAGNVAKLPAGIYKYMVNRHVLIPAAAGDRREDICRAALQQKFIAEAPAVLLFCAVKERITRRYGERGISYLFMEVGHAAQNVCLQAVALGIGTVVIGAFRDNAIKAIANLPDEELPVYLIPIGRR